MPISSYPNGFAHGISIRGVPITMTHPGQVFWVNSTTVLADGGIVGSDENDGTYRKPFATVDFAFSQCTPDRGDIIMVMPGYTQTISAAAGIDMDVAGVAVIGLGNANSRPTITFDTATTADIDINAANIALMNFRFIGNIAASTRPLVGLCDQTVEHPARRFDESFQYSPPLGGHGREAPGRLVAQATHHLLGIQCTVDVLLVELEHDRDDGRGQPLGTHVELQVLQRPAVLLQSARARVGDEDHRVGPRKHDLPRRVVAHLPGNRVELHCDPVAENVAQVEGQEVEEQRPVVGGLDGEKFLPTPGIGDAVQ